MDNATTRRPGDPSESRPVSATNGWRKTLEPGTSSTKPTIYRECHKNHAASIGGHALDGCGEFMADSGDPLKCAACGCHRNFHRSDANFPRPFPLCNYCTIPPPPLPSPPPPSSQLNHGGRRSSESPPAHLPSPYNSAPQMLLALSGGGAAAQAEARPATEPGSLSTGRRRMRTKFSKEQKERMLAFAERIGWRLHRQDEQLIQRFCDEIGIKRSVLKVWMHNHKNNLAPKDHTENPNS